MIKGTFTFNLAQLLAMAKRDMETRGHRVTRVETLLAGPHGEAEYTFHFQNAGFDFAVDTSPSPPLRTRPAPRVSAGQKETAQYWQRVRDALRIMGPGKRVQVEKNVRAMGHRIKSSAVSPALDRLVSLGEATKQGDVYSLLDRSVVADHAEEEKGAGHAASKIDIRQQRIGAEDADLRRHIVELLKSDPGQSVSKLRDAFGFGYTRVGTVIDGLVKEGKVKVVKQGRRRMHYVA